MALSPEQTLRMQQIQAKVLAGTHTIDELKEGVGILRGDRVAAQASSTTARTKAAADKKVVDPTAVLAGLKALGAKLASGPVA